jgi:hypothetical protein
MTSQDQLTNDQRAAIDSRLHKLAKRDGALLVDSVVEDASNPTSPMHDCFEWDLQKAALNDWRATARRLIQSYQVRVTVDEEIVVVPTWVRDTTKAPTEQGYAETLQVRDSKELAAETLRSELARLASMFVRVVSLARVFGLQRMVEPFVKKFNVFRRRIEEKIPAPPVS